MDNNEAMMTPEELARSKAVRDGRKYESLIETILSRWGFRTTLTNHTNEYDPKNYKHGFDGGIDIIATYTIHAKRTITFTFNIQCKHLSSDLTKDAISQVYAGTVVRKNNGFPVVIAQYEDISTETLQYASDLNVEIIPIRQDEPQWIIKKIYHPENYKPFGNLMKLFMYIYTHDVAYLKAIRRFEIPNESEAILVAQNEADEDYEHALALLKTADNYERKARESRYQAIEIQKTVVHKSLMLCEYYKKALRERPRPKETKEPPEITLDSD